VCCRRAGYNVLHVDKSDKTRWPKGAEGEEEEEVEEGEVVVYGQD